MAPIITFTTDFGLTDSYVAQVKGVILGIVPDATLVDITHNVPPQDVVAGSAILADAVGAFRPARYTSSWSILGVGSDRLAVAVEDEGRGKHGRPAVCRPR